MFHPFLNNLTFCFVAFALFGVSTGNGVGMLLSSGAIHAQVVNPIASQGQTGNPKGTERFSEYRKLYAENDTNSENATERVGNAFDFMNTVGTSPVANTLPGMGVPGFGATAPTLLVTSKHITLPSGEFPGTLRIFVQIPEGFKIYSITQEAGGPFPTKINLPKEMEVVGDILAEPVAHKEVDKETWGDITIETHKSAVSWVVPFRWKEGMAVPQSVTGSVEAQMCDANSCLPPKKFPFTAPVPIVQEEVVELPEEEVLPEANISEEESFINIPTVKPAQSAEVPKNQIIELKSSEPVQAVETLPLENQSLETQPIEIAEPTARQEIAPPAEPALDDSFSNYGTDYSLTIILVMAYLGGLILNLMPCVLPVIAPKLHSFVKQAGEARGRVFLLNVAYTLGLLTVLWLLATFSRIADLLTLLRGILPSNVAEMLPEMNNMGWGQQFTYPSFVIFMISLVFIMGLSFLGVWEIPIPGMVTGGKLSKMQRKEGFLGAYCMGILTTLLATPCVGPYLGSVFGWVMTQQVWMSFVVFTVIGLGLGTPYLLIGAIPELIRFLPKPGEWMETFKEVMGFFFLGTVVWLFFVLPASYCVQTLGFLVALWFACWLIGKTTLSGASREALLVAWTAGIVVVLLAGFTFFSLGVGSRTEVFVTTAQSDEIAWEPFSEALVEQYRAENQIVFIDFTARWCATCQTNGKFAIGTTDVAQFIRENNIVPVLADWSEPSEEIDAYLKKMGRNSIPLIVIWIPGQAQPLLIDGLVTKANVIQALDFAVKNAVRL